MVFQHHQRQRQLAQVTGRGLHKTLVGEQQLSVIQVIGFRVCCRGWLIEADFLRFSLQNQNRTSFPIFQRIGIGAQRKAHGAKIVPNGNRSQTACGLPQPPVLRLTVHIRVNDGHDGPRLRQKNGLLICFPAAVPRRLGLHAGNLVDFQRQAAIGIGVVTRKGLIIFLRRFHGFRGNRVRHSLQKRFFFLLRISQEAHRHNYGDHQHTGDDPEARLFEAQNIFDSGFHAVLAKSDWTHRYGMSGGGTGQEGVGIGLPLPFSHARHRPLVTCHFQITAE